MKSLEKTLDRITELSARRKEVIEEIADIDAELMELLGINQPEVKQPKEKKEKLPKVVKVARIEKEVAAAPGKVKGQKICRNCGVPGHIAKTCPSAKKEEDRAGGEFKGDAPAQSSNKKDFPIGKNPLSAGQYHNVMNRRSMYGSPSAELAQQTGLPEDQIRRAIRTKNYEDYMSDD